MKRPSLRRLYREHAHLFHLGKTKVSLHYAGIAGDGFNGLCYPPPYTGRQVCVILIEADLQRDEFLPLLLHELIHAEQWEHFQKLSHDAYFDNRVAELRALGLRVADREGLINAAE